jgi:hypothetical protein
LLTYKLAEQETRKDLVVGTMVLRVILPQISFFR